MKLRATLRRIFKRQEVKESLVVEVMQGPFAGHIGRVDAVVKGGVWVKNHHRKVTLRPANMCQLRYKTEYGDRVNLVEPHLLRVLSS